MECVSSISCDGRATRCRTAQTQRQQSASAKRQRVQMASLERSIRSPPSIGGSIRSRNSVLRWKDRASSPVPAVANTPRRQRGCATPCRSPLQTSFCEQTSLRSLSCGAFPAFRAHERPHGRPRYTLAGARACRETSEFVASDPAVVAQRRKVGRRRIEKIGEVARFGRLCINVGCAQATKSSHVCPSVGNSTNANVSC
jgi:hypothetical protein